MTRHARRRFALLVFAASVATASTAAAAVLGQRAPASRKPTSAAGPPLARVIWLEGDAATKPERGKLAVYRRIVAGDPRMKDLERWLDTEATRFARRLVYRAAKRFGADTVFGEPVLPIVIRKDGNNAAVGLAIQTPHGVEQHEKFPYLILDANAASLGDTLLHETGHLLQSLAVSGKRDRAAWSAFPHTTFAVSDRITALAEGFAIHFEAMWGHFGSDSAKMAYYHRLAPVFKTGQGRQGEYFAPVDDLMNFAQVWARYQGVRDGMAAFEGHVYPGNYARSQMDPARDRSALKAPNAMLASEGVAASVIFWTAAALAEEQHAQPRHGLDQPGLIDAEMALLEAFSRLPDPDGSRYSPDLLDLVEAVVRVDARTGEAAVARFVDVTKGVTARPALRAEWRKLYDAALVLDFARAKAIIPALDAQRTEIVTRARADIRSLRAGIGPVVPVSLPAVTFQLKALGEAMPVEFDLNGMSQAELALLAGVTDAARERIERERERAPFASLEDFAARTGVSPQAAGLVAVSAGQVP